MRCVILMGVLAALAPIDTLAQELNCEAVLRFGLFDVATYQRDSAVAKRLDESLCRTRFETHQEARNLGLGVGVPVYGVPLQLHGSFDTQHQQQWLDAHCKSVRASEDLREFMSSYVSKASATIVEAWNRCVSEQAKMSQVGLRCDIASPTSRHIVFSAEWKKGHSRDTGPEVRFLQSYGGRCHFGRRPKFLTGKYTVDCERSSEQEAVTLVLETESGRCMASVPGYDGTCKERRFPAGVTTLSGDTHVNCDRIVFEDGAVVKVEGRAVFSARDGIISLGSATIDGRGAKGSTGAPGTGVPSDAWWTSSGDDDYWRAHSDCRTNESHSDRGKPGQPGGRGGKGATVVMTKAPAGTLSVLVDGGEGGEGGPGGSGRPYRNGRQFHCNGCMSACPSGAQGPRGPQGGPGEYLLFEEAPMAPRASR